MVKNPPPPPLSQEYSTTKNDGKRKSNVHTHAHTPVIVAYAFHEDPIFVVKDAKQLP